ncbi:MAG: glycosyltransferase family 2 protein [Ruminococcaceae bacterium]|nr:glycosyltransferase family 2 protein [Oscillospiraceae bacterium]
MEKISIIVPVYRVEPYLRLCIESILSQTHRDFELILVDDGSPDSCGAICDEYAARDNRITVIHQENGGLSAARNTGIDWVFANSDSQWITFADSDDALAPIMLETLYREAVRHQADIAITNPATFTEDIQLEKEGKYVGESSCYTGKALLEPFYNGENLFSIATWGKLFRKELFQELRFPLGKWHEDEATTPILLYHAEKVVLVRSWLYYYRQREGSIMNRAFSVKRFDHVDALDFCASYFEEQQSRGIAKLARRHCNMLWARMTITARQKGIYHQLPERYRMGVPKALWLLLISSLCSGGISFVIKRLRNLLRGSER